MNNERKCILMDVGMNEQMKEGMNENMSVGMNERRMNDNVAM